MVIPIEKEKFDEFNFFFSKKSRSVLLDGSRSLKLFRKSKTCIIAKIHWTDSVICSDSREGKTPSYSQVNTINGHLRLITCTKSAHLEHTVRCAI